MSPAPRFSTADIAKGAQERKDERIEQEHEAERLERDRTSAPHIAGTNPITPPGPATPVTSEAEAATVRAQETRAERDTDAAIARAATTGATNVTNTERQLAEDSAAPLFATDAATNFRQRWDSVQ